MKTIIVIPTYNEKDNIPSLVEQIFNAVPDVNILIVDDNSPDGTGQLTDQLAKNNHKIKVLHRPFKQGLGRAYAEAFTYLSSSDADCIISMDADFSHDPKYLPELLKYAQDFDVVIGSRYIQGISILNWSLLRLILSVSANRYVKIATGLPINDCTSGFVCYRKSALAQIDFKNFASGGHAFLFELKYKLFRKGFRLKEVPIVFTERRTGRSKVSKKIITEAFFTALKLRFHNIT